MLEVALNELQDVWQDRAVAVVAQLAPGVQSDVASKLASAHGLTLPPEVMTYFAWHNGLSPERDSDIEWFPAMSPLALDEALALQQQVGEVFDGMPALAPVLTGSWLPLLSDYASEFLIVSCEPGADTAVYQYDLTHPGGPEARFPSVAAMIQTLVKLHRKGIYAFTGTELRVTDEVAAQRIISGSAATETADAAGADPGVMQPRNAQAGIDEAAAIALSVTISSMEGLERAVLVLDAMDEHGVPTVNRAIAKLDFGARDELAGSLGATNQSSAAPLLLALLGDPQDYVRETATGAIGLTGEPSVGPALFPLLHSKNRNIRKAAAFSLGELRVAHSSTSLLPLLTDANPAVRAAAATALGKIAEPVDIAPLVELLQDSYPDAAQMAAWALGEIGNVAAMPALREAATASDPTLARIAASALQALEASGK